MLIMNHHLAYACEQWNVQTSHCMARSTHAGLVRIGHFTRDIIKLRCRFVPVSSTDKLTQIAICLINFEKSAARPRFCNHEPLLEGR